MPKPDRENQFDIEAFLDALGVARTARTFRKNEAIFVQGDPACDVLFIRKGRVKRTVVSQSGNEAVVGILGPGDFLGEWGLSDQPVCIATAVAGEWGLSDQPVCIATAVAMEPTTILAISKDEMRRAFHTEHSLADAFISYLLSRTLRIEEKLIDQLFLSTEKRLARALLRLAGYGRHVRHEMRVPKISQQMLAEMIGTTRPHVNHFMNEFKRAGFIDYDVDCPGELLIRPSLADLAFRE